MRIWLRHRMDLQLIINLLIVHLNTKLKLEIQPTSFQLIKLLVLKHQKDR